MKNLLYFLSFFSTTFILFSCVPYRSLEDQRIKTTNAEKDRARMLSEYNAIKLKVDSIENNQIILNKTIEYLKRDTAMSKSSLRTYIAMDNENKKRMEQLSRTTDRILDANLGENDRLNAQVKVQKDDLQRQKEELEKKEAAFEVAKSDFYKAQNQLSDKESKIKDLQSALEKKDAAVKDIRAKVADALTGFQSSGLTVAENDGKVYVILPEALLFKSGSKSIDNKGKDALNSLANVLRMNPDINIAVEGHTDNVPYRPKSSSAMVEDNWDLSVLRATSVVKILTSAGVSPIRISAQGRGEFIPINTGSSANDRAINRRTEIILTPKLDQILKALD